MENKIIHIDYYVTKLMTDKNFFKKERKCFIENDYSIQDAFGYIEPHILNCFIRKAKRHRKYRTILSDVLLYVDHNSMTDENFRLLLKFPGRCRVTYLSNISHAELSFYQMKIINRYPLSLEAFFWLFDNVCKYDIFTCEDMLDILRENKSIKKTAVYECINLAEKQYGVSEKLNVAKKWVETNHRTVP